MKNKLQLLFESEDTGLLRLEKEIDYTPSKGLIIYQPIHGEIGTVVFDKGYFTAVMNHVAEPTNPKEQLEYLTNMGFKQVKV